MTDSTGQVSLLRSVETGDLTVPIIIIIFNPQKNSRGLLKNYE